MRLNPRGISLPVAIGLVLLLMTASAAVNQLIIRTLRSVQQIEASSRAYAIAEAGIEDALYELSAHFAGYETPALDDEDDPYDPADPFARNINFGGNVPWESRWRIQSHDLQNCTGTIDMEPIDLCGELLPNRKLALSFFNDKGAAIQTLDISTFQVQFKVPSAVISANIDAFSVLRPSGSAGLIIDNDGDAWVTAEDDGINEDGENEGDSCSLPGRGTFLSGRDADCDGRDDEDSPEDPVIYWKLLDNAGHTLTPKKGCLDETDPALPAGSELCEKNFVSLESGGNVLATLDQTAWGVREDGTEEMIATFLNNSDGVPAPESQLQMEFLIVAPLEQADASSKRKIPIPALEYEVATTETAGEKMPAPYFVIQSDGNYQDFKQSITTTLTPKTSVPLGDFTLIQQQ